MKIAHACVVAGLVVPCLAAAEFKANCTSDCSVTVRVSPQGCGGGISVTPDPIVLMVGRGSLIKWTVASPGWSFADNGIVVNKPDTEFDVVTRDKTSITYKFKNSKKAGYKYDINLVSTATPSVPCSIDPTILNY